jgi:hypothetical protein
MYYYVVSGVRVDNGVEESIRTFDSTMDLTDVEARAAAMEYELIVLRNEKYSSCRVQRKMLILK